MARGEGGGKAKGTFGLIECPLRANISRVSGLEESENVGMTIA